MSTILKALRRLEDDRNAQSSRPLREAVASGSAEQRKRRGGAWLLAGALGLAVGLGASGGTYWFATREGAQNSVAATPEVVAAVARVEAPAPVPSESAEARVSATPDAAESSSSKSIADSSVQGAAETAEQRELSPAALTSPVAMLDRPPAEPRIAASEESGETLVFGARPIASANSSGAARGTHKPGSRPVPATSWNVERLISSPSDRLLAAGRSSPSVARGMKPPNDAATGARPARRAAASDGDPWEMARAADAEAHESASPAPSRPAARPASQASAKAVSAPRPAADESSETVEIAAAGARPAAPRPAAAPPAKRASAPPPAKRTAAPPPAAAAHVSAKGTSVARAEIPGVRVERIYWHPKANRRTAVIAVDGSVEEIQEGDAVGPLVVSTIEPSGVVFEHEGVEIRRPVGE